MGRVNLEFVRTAREIVKALDEAVAEVRAALRALPSFCQDCGATDAELYPVLMFGPDDLSPFLCLRCERERRVGAARDSTEGNGS